jgi:type II secretion system protein D
MRRTRAAGVVVASLLASSGVARSVWAQEGAAGASTSEAGAMVGAAPEAAGETAAVAPEAAGVAAGDGATKTAAQGGAADGARAGDAPAVPARAEVAANATATIGFNFKDAPIDRVLDFFARESKLPIIFEAPVPQGAITFVSVEKYTFEEALSILNLNLARFGVLLRVDGRYLYLATLQDSMRRPVQVATPEEVARFAPETILTVNIPLDNARVEQVADQVKAMIGPFGGVLAVPNQNMLIVVESAAQIQRIRKVVDSIDAVQAVDSAFKIFPLQHAEPDAVLAALKGLLGERQRTVIVDKDGKSRVVEEVAVTGINMTADPRTNSIIAVGAQSRIDTARELIGLLDVPATGQKARDLATIALASTNADEAAQRINALFAKVEDKERPTVIALPRAAKVSILGTQTQVAQARELIRELEGGSSPDDERTTAAIVLSNANAANAEAIVSRLLQGSLGTRSRIIAGPDGRTLLVNATTSEMEMVRSLVDAVDSTPSMDRDVRVVRLGEDAAQVLERAREFYAKTGRAEREPVEATLDAAGGSATLVGSRAALSGFDQALAAAREAGRGAPEARRYTVTQAMPSIVAERLRRLVAATDSADASPAQIDALDDLGLLVVRAEASRQAVIKELLESLDSVETRDRTVRVLRVRGESAESLRERTLAAMGMSADDAAVPRTTVDAASGALILSGMPSAVDRFAQVAQQLQQVSGEGREVRLFALASAKAGDVAAALENMSQSSETLGAASGVRPAFEAIDATNAILAAGSSQQLAVIEGLVRGLDVPGGDRRAPLRILRVQAADAMTLAQAIRRSFDERTPADRAARPVRVEVDTAANTLIVSAHEEDLAEIQSLVGEANKAATDRAMSDDSLRQVRIFPLRVARAEELATTLEQMFPEPPAPIDVRTRQPRPDLRPPREVLVRADRATNSLIVDAVSTRLVGLEEIIAQLDKPALARSVSLRTYRIARADVNAAAEALRRMSGSGALGAEAGAVTVAVEPASRTLMVSAPDGAFEAVEKLLTELNATPEAGQKQTKLYTLEHARADRLQPMLRTMIERASQQALEAAGATLRPGEAAAEVVADAGTNTVIVIAPAGAMAQADSLIAQLDSDAVTSAADVRVVRLSKGSAASVASALGPAMAATQGAKPITVTADAASNSVVLAGARADVERAEALVGEMDVAVDAQGVGVRTIALKHARAEALAPTIEGALRQQSMIEMIPEWQRYDVMRRGGIESAPPVRAVADTRSNAVVVSGPRALLDLAEQVVQGLDVAGESQSVVRVLRLTNADATQLAATVSDVFTDASATSGPAPVIRVDAAANALVVRATPEQMTQVESLVREVDAAALANGHQMRVIGVDRSRADAQQLAEMLKRVLEQQGNARVRVIDANELLKDGSKGAGKPTSMRGVEMDVIGFFEVAPGVPMRAQPAAIAAMMAMAQVGDGAGANGEGGGGDDDAGEITIAVDPATNSLVVVGSETLTKRIAELAKALQTQMPQEPVQANIVRMPQGVEAGPIADVVRTTVQQMGRASDSNPGGLTGAVSVLADPSGASLIVLSRPTDFDTLRPLMASLIDTDQVGSLSVKVYPLTNTTADRAARSLQDLFLAAPRGRQAQRVRAVDLAIDGPGGAISGRIDPASIRVSQSPSGTSLIVAAPAEALGLIDRLIEAVDQSPVTDRLEITRYAMKNARAEELSRTLQSLFDAQRQGPGAEDSPQARFIADDRTNSLLVTASRQQHAEVLRVLASADAPADEAALEMALITLQNASPSTVQRIVEEVVIGRDPAKRDLVRISASDDSRLLVVRAPAELLVQVRDIIAQADTTSGAGLPVRSITLERADAAQVATALQRFFSDRARLSGRSGRGDASVAVVGDKRSGTIVVAASDEDFATIQGLVKSFDSPAEARDLQLKVVPLVHADATATAETLRNLSEELRWNSWDRGDGESSDVFIETNPRTNSLVLMGRGEAFATVERVLSTLDQPAEEGQASQVAMAIEVKNADLQAVRNAIQRVMVTPGWRSWRGQDPAAVTVEVDRVRRSLILVGARPRVEQAAQYVKSLDTQGEDATPLVIEAITLQNARADRAGSSLRQFFADRARAQGIDTPAVNIIGSTDGNVLIVSGDEASVATLKDLVAQIDQPDQGKDRRVEVFVLRNGTAADAANVMRSVFASKPGTDNAVVVTPQPSTNSLIVAAPEALFPQVEALLNQLDAPPNAEDVNIETVALKTARASDVAAALRSALPANVKVTVTPVPRSNSIILTGSSESIALAMQQVSKLDEEPTSSGLVFKRFKLAAGDASDISYTLDQLLDARPRSAGDSVASIDYSRTDNTITVYAPADQIAEIERIVTELDQPLGEEKTTEFVKLEYARAEQAAAALKVFYGRYAPEAESPGARSVTIIPDTVSNSLVVRAEKSQWEGLRALLAKLDTKEYDTSRQLVVIPLEHAEAQSVARALNEGFRAPIEEQIRRAEAESRRSQGGQGRDARNDVPILVDAGSVPTVSAETRTNSLVVFAKAKDAERIQAIVKQLDVAGFDDMPAPRIIPLLAGKPSAIAATIRQVYLNQDANTRGPRSTLVIGDDQSSALIVRADDESYAQVAALAQALQSQGQAGRIQPHVVRLQHVSALRLKPTLLAAFSTMAQQQGESLAIEVDRSSNTLVIACTPRLLEQIKSVINELDQRAQADEAGAAAADPVLGDTLLIADVNNNDPLQIRAILEQLGVTRAQSADRQGLVSEPVTLSILTSRRAIAIAGAAADARAVASLVKTLDTSPTDAEQTIAVVNMKVARASAVARTLNAMLSPAANTAPGAGPAKALAEHVRRLSVTGAGALRPDQTIDLTVPIRLIPDDEANILVIASNKANVAAMQDVAASLDRLPIGDAVLVRIFPLENSAASRVKATLDALFSQGDALRRLPGTNRDAMPSTTTGGALASRVVVTVDERSNSLLVAGREEAVALVEVLVRDLDGKQAGAWVEPQVIALVNADAASMADRLNQILVRGMAATPDAMGLQRQYGRLRIADDADVKAPEAAGSPSFVEADLFAPVTNLIIVAQEETNSLLVIATPANNAAIRALVAQLDVPLTDLESQVRIFPLKFAAADRVATLVREFFRQRVATETQPKKADQVVISTDARTNTLIISSSPRSMAMVESLLKTFDAEQANFMVGMHVIPVKDVDVRQVAPRIERLMRERLAASAQAGAVRNPMDTFTIEAEPVNNVLIVSASDENLAVVKELIDALTANASTLAASERVEILNLTKARASEIAESINSLYVEREAQRRGPSAVRVTPNERLNALIVSGNEQDMIEIRALAARLDRADIAAIQQIKWLPLRSANASEVVQLLQSVLAGRPLGGGRGVGARQATRVQFLRDTIVKDLAAKIGDKPTEAELDGAIRDQVTLTADTRTNSVWITAPETMMVLLTEMIQDMEASSAGARKIEHFRLLNADARQMAALLRDTFNLQEQGRSLVLVPTGVPELPDEFGDVASSSVTPVPDERMQLAIAVDARTNTLVVSGTEEYLTLVRDLIQELDSIQANERDRRVYHLRNAKAKDIETTLQSYFRGENDTERRTLGGDLAGSLQRRLEEEVTVIGDQSSNKLVISTSPRYMDAVMEIVEELDSAPPQVMIQVLLAEVTLDQSEQWGMDVSVGPFGGEAYRVGSSAAQSGAITSLGVPNLSVSSADFSLLVRALEAQGKLEVLSNPQVLANNNEPARIQVGEDVPIVDGVERSSQGQTFANVRREKVGIILDVTPSISSEGFVRMEISPVISNLTTRSVELSSGISSPIIAERTVDTVVTVKDGQSVVIGGLIQTTEEQRKSKVPILGDIPFLGVPFRTTSMSNVKTELLVILTPRVVGGQSDVDVARVREISQQAIDRLEDPTGIEDYLEQIKSDIRRSRSTGGYVPLVPGDAVETLPLPTNEDPVLEPMVPLAPDLLPLDPVDPYTPYDPLVPDALAPAPSVPLPSRPEREALIPVPVVPAPGASRVPDPDALGPLVPVPPRS